MTAAAQAASEQLPGGLAEWSIPTIWPGLGRGRFRAADAAAERFPCGGSPSYLTDCLYWPTVS
jgi:hypothetical protein